MPYVYSRNDIYELARVLNVETHEKGDELWFKYCPYCHGGGDDKDTFSINLESGVFHCFRSGCMKSGHFVEMARDFGFHLENDNVPKRYKRLPQKQIVVRDPAVEFMKSRGISEETTRKYQITTRNDRDDIIVFPFYDENNVLVFVKYRNANHVKGQGPKEWCEKDAMPILFGMNHCEGFERIIITEGQCFNGDAEIMTPDGWVRFEDYAGQEVLQVDESMHGSFVRPKAYIRKIHTGKMVDVSIGGNYFTSTTDDHNLVFVNRKGKVIKKQAIEKISSAYIIPTTISLSNKKNDWSNDEIALLLAISADGTIDVRKNTGPRKSDYKFYARFGLRKQRKIERLIGILNRLGFDYSSNLLNQNGENVQSICFSIPDKFGTKYLPWWFVTETSFEQKRFIVEEVKEWDGNRVNGRNQYEYYSSVKHNAEVVQAVASTCGYMSTIMAKNFGGNGKYKRSLGYKVSILLNKKYVSTQQFEKYKNVYNVNKIVYCVSIDTGMILVRQNGCISVSGNCDSLSISDCGVSNAVSVPNGCNGFTFLDNVWDWIVKFQEVVVFGDCEKGKITLLDTLAKRLPVKVKGVRPEDYLGEKDANDIYRKYGKQAILTAIENAEVPPVKHVKELADVQSVDLFNLPKIRTGLKELDSVIGGLYFGQVVLLTGKRGEGKSTLLSQLLVEAMDQNYSIFAYSGELADYHFKRWMDFQAAGPEFITTQKSMYGEEYYQIPNDIVERINAWYRGRAYIYDNNSVDDNEMESLISTIEHTIQRYDVKVIAVDNLMTAMDFTGDDIYKAQSAFVKALKNIALKYNVVVILVAHPRKTQMDGKPGAELGNDDVSGSSDITNRVDLVMAYSRNYGKTNPDDTMQADSRLSVTKNRLTGKLTQKGKGIDLFYSQKSKRISSVLSKDKSYGWQHQKVLKPNLDWLDEEE